MEIGERLEVRARDEWRVWLADHYQDKQEIWLVLYNSGFPQRALAMREAQEEALAFGWVDSYLKPIDAASYALRFSRRRPGSLWSATNKARARKLLSEGRMAPAGMSVLPPDVLDEAAGGHLLHCDVPGTAGRTCRKPTNFASCGPDER